mmetsp:Transcript_55339/g.139897  ORF Transcript_55339/g.139897 Transcript_55339/m.139897 type:complete len:246 (-) Transcript_55339:554-1291(-)
MFITVMAAMRMNTKNNTAANAFSARTSFMKKETLHSKVPRKSKVYMASGTMLKYFSPSGVPAQSCVKPTPNTYMTMISKHKVNKTDRNAAAMALISVMSSGVARRSRATRAMRKSLNSRKRRKMEESPPSDAKAEVPPLVTTTRLMTHVSKTIMGTKSESRRNQRSLNPCHLCSKAKKRTHHSKTKNAQKKCATSWKPTSDSVSTSLSLKSVSTAIHRAFMATTVKLKVSKRWCFAMAWHKPSSL